MKLLSLLHCALVLTLAATTQIVCPRTCPAQDSQAFVLNEITAVSIIVDNNRIIPEATLKSMIAPYLNRRISYIDLELLRNNLTLWVVQNGYINSGVIIPDQDISGGVVHMAVVEGRISSITVEGTGRFSKDYFIDRIRRETDPPFRVSSLQEAFQLFYQDQRISKINAELSGGLVQGEANLKLKVTETSPWKLTLSATNDNSPSIGSYRGELIMAHRNLTGVGDTLEANFGGSEGGYDYGARYSRPLNVSDTMLDIYFRQSESNVIDDQFKPLDINSNSATYGFRLSHPLTRSVRREVRPSVSLEYRESKNYLLGQGFSFSVHESNGQSRLSAVRPSIEWIERRDGAVIVGSTGFSTGISNESFFTWQGRLLWMQRTGIASSRVHLRGDVQLSDTGLPPMEKYALGGINSVRGYRKNVLIKDNGLNASLEWWFPLIRDNATGAEFLSVAPFFDYGRGWDSGHEAADAGRVTDLAGTGLGLRWSWKDLSADFFYGYGFLKSGIASGNDPQEHGIHFNVNWNIL